MFHMMLALALVGIVLLQRSEGGALGIGGGGFMSGRGTANLLTRATAVLAALFMLSSLGLTILAASATRPRSILEDVQAPGQPVEAPAEPAVPSVPVAD
jgi:preprotein translocase subunit SecG